MRLKIALATLAIVAVPTLASAAGCNWHDKEQTASQCPQGQTFDETKGACVTQSTS